MRVWEGRAVWASNSKKAQAWIDVKQADGGIEISFHGQSTGLTKAEALQLSAHLREMADGMPDAKPERA